ncbi:hypothetical protein [Nocardia sp. NPDC052566]|uniref:hypothetical protein n=1 Tax=Nocardia sp. NPDC052566 TaxID=3364330 RepID=UPI0037CABD80
MGSIVVQLLPLVGVVLGAGATFSATALNQRAKWRRGHDARWDEKRLVAYSEFANALKRSATSSNRVAATLGYPVAVQPIDVDEGLRAMAEAEADKTTKWEVVLLLGSPAAVAAARSWNRAAWELSWVARGRVMEHTAYIELFAEMGRRRNAFYECARADLGVCTGALPPGDQPWLPPCDDSER